MAMRCSSQVSNMLNGLYTFLFQVLTTNLFSCRAVTTNLLGSIINFLGCYKYIFGSFNLSGTLLFKINYCAIQVGDTAMIHL